MIRSLFIGLLILSSLASKGAEAQIIKKPNVSADMLINLFNTHLACEDKANRLSAAGKCSFSKSNVFDAGMAGVLNSKTDSMGTCIWIAPAEHYFLMQCFNCKYFEQTVVVCTGEYFCMSGLSPPNTNVHFD